MNPFHKPMRRRGLAGLVVSAALCLAALAATPAQAEFGITDFDVTFTNADGEPQTQAGSHPFAMTIGFKVNSVETGFLEGYPEEDLKDIVIEQIPGLIGDVSSFPRCDNEDFILGIEVDARKCSGGTVVGVASVNVPEPALWPQSAVFNLVPPPGAVARFGFTVLGGVKVILDLRLKRGGDYNVVGAVLDAPTPYPFFGGRVQIWGVPADPAHDSLRGEACGSAVGFAFSGFPGFKQSASSCPTNEPERPLLTLPTSCVGPAMTSYRVRSWLDLENWVEGGVLTHDNAEPPNPIGMSGCGRLGFSPTVESKATADSAESGSGLDFDVRFEDEGLKNPMGLAQTQTEKAEVTLPKGVTINPSVGEGLGVCTPADLDRETLDAAPGEGCPNSSKVGSLDVETPLVNPRVEGSIFLAEQDDPRTAAPGAENPFDSLVALYFVLKNTQLGVIVKLPALVEPDPLTGQILVTLDDVPQFPFNHFNAHLREGVRSALVTPPRCGTHTTETKLYPYSDPDNPRTVTSSFEITSGVNGGSCPSGGVPPFNPHFEAGSINNNAGSYSPFIMRLTRADGDQDMTKFSSVLPPGVLGSLAGVSKCPDANVAIAKTKTGKEELAAPSCPPNSAIGRTLAGAGVGSALTYVGGAIYLAGPYKGAPLSVVSVTPAVAGPFDAGTVVVRLGLDLNPVTAEVEVDGAASDPIPHILKGIVLKVRDLRVYVDRPAFTLNPTSCDESSARATLFGSFLDVLDPADDVPVALSTRYQAANCLNLGYQPKLNVNLKGGTRRGAFPAFRANYKPRPGDANIEGLVLRLPRSAFLEQGHIRTICTRVQFAVNACPKASQYGYVRAWTPLLDEPLQGPVYLRSSNNKLPDVVFDLKGIVDIEVATRIDSVRGGIRATLTDLPDAPISRVVLRMQGGKKGLIVNSRQLCAAKSRANLRFSGQNGKRLTRNTLVRPLSCKRKARRGGKRAALSGLSAVG